MKYLHFVSLFVVFSVFFSCDEQFEPRHAPATEAAFQPGNSSSGGLPAWETAAERRTSGKADEWDDYRIAHPELFGVTAPPVVPVRSFAEYEPAQAVMLRPSQNISPFHRDIFEGLVGHVNRIVVFHLPGHAEGLQAKLESWNLYNDSIEFVDIKEINANWTRDYGPLSVVTAEGHVAFADFRYYHGRAYDDAIPSKLAEHWNINVFRPSLSYEGGNFMADPHGTCYATEKIYQQNAGYSKAEVDQWMQQYAGCSHLVTLKWPKGLGTGHIDMFSKLMSDTKVLLGEYNPALQPENAEILDENAAILEAVVTESGESLSVYRIPLPWDDSGIWFTYTNSLIVNDTVLIPIYGKFKDLEAQALASYEQVSPDLSHHLINSDAIIPAGGAIHCVTMSVPNGALEKFQDDPVVLCPLNDINKCDSEGTVCGGLLQEGMCEDSLLKYCGQDGYPHAQACAECCGWDAGGLGGLGWYDCLAGTACAGCIEECVEGDSGCSAQSTQSWTCEQLDDDACLERKWAACPRVTICNSDTGECEVPEEYCVDGVCPETCGDIDEEGICEGELLLWCDDGLLLSQDCTAGGQVCGANPSLGGSLGCWAGCTDACPFDGARTCTEDGLLQVCATDRWGCLDYGVPEPCDEGLVCFDGVCGEPRPEPVIEDITTGDIQTPHNPKPKNKGCAAGSASSTTLPLLLLLLLLLGIRTGPGPCG